MRENRKGRHGRVLRILISLLAIGIVAFGALVAYVCMAERRIPEKVSELGSYDAIIVLGAQVKRDGTPNVQLQWRLDAATEAWEAHPVPIVVCGAQGSDEPAPEAEVMKQVLVDAGIPEGQILTDPNSFNTRENLQNAQQLLGDGVETVLIVTSQYHAPRALALARDTGMEAIGLGSPIKAEYWIKNHFREALAWVKYWAQKYLGLRI